MTNEQLMSHELNHRHAGNGYAAVEIQPSTKSTFNGKTLQWVLITDKWCQKGQAFLASRDYLEIYRKPQGNDSDGNPVSPVPVKLTHEELAKLAPWRDGLASGALKVESTRFVKS